MSLSIEGKTVLVTGANRRIGSSLVDEALSRGANASTKGRASGSRTRPEVRDEDGTWIPHGISVLEIEEGQIVGIDAFLDPTLVPRFGAQQAARSRRSPRRRPRCA